MAEQSDPKSQPSSLAAFEAWIAGNEDGAALIRRLMADLPSESVRSLAELAYRAGYITGSGLTGQRIFAGFERSFENVFGAVK